MYLQFLQTICVCDGLEIRKNQDMILNELLQSELLQYTSYCNADKMGIDELCVIMQKSSSSSSAADTSSTLADDFRDSFSDRLSTNRLDPFISFHVELIKVIVFIFWNLN